MDKKKKPDIRQRKTNCWYGYVLKFVQKSFVSALWKSISGFSAALPFFSFLFNVKGEMGKGTTVVASQTKCVLTDIPQH